MKPKKAGVPPRKSGSWVCPHCYRREPLGRYLIRTEARIPLHADRRRFYHLRQTLGLPEESTTCLLADPRLMRREELAALHSGEAPGNTGEANLFCVHCHMPALIPLREAVLCGVISSGEDLTRQFLRAVTAEGDMSAVCRDWLSLPQPPALNYAARYALGCQWFCIPRPEDTPGDPDYRQLLRDRLMVEAEEYVLLLRLDTAGDEEACLLLKQLADLHGAPEETRKKSAAVIVFLPEAEPTLDPGKHLRFFRLLCHLFSGHTLSPVRHGESLGPVLNKALTELAVQDGLAEPVPAADTAAGPDTPPS